ncbi:hypothetical protein GCM10027169_04260 [Gordonia jinhuaensis]|uniref:Primosomal protein n=1 Tax=Gordonia jinhuaensis TaxID=1517702 RepID=A0A916SUA8_9ACTN|nr:primosomal protein [Gordonia jinhuaensis]GGB16874.1 hypothetical protein GCM10011489_01220 [Gordonia jinhuaensis]
MAGDIIPIELGLTDGNVFTLWAPRWRDGDDEWQAFLGLDEDLYTFGSVAELVTYVRTDAENDLSDHPAWPTLPKLAAGEFVPTEEHSYDVIGVPELAAEDPTPEVIAELEDVLDIVRTIGEVCELTAVTKFFNGNPILGAVTAGTRNFTGREGQDFWVRIGRLIDKSWDDVVDAIEGIASTPEFDHSGVEEAQEEIDAAASAEDEDEPTDDDDVEIVSGAAVVAGDDESDDDDDDDDDIADEDDFWTEVGIDPVRIVTSAGEYVTLRCYLGDDPVFLGRDGKIFVFSSDRALLRYLADATDHDLAEVSTYPEVQTAATDGSLEIDVYDDNVYVLPGISEDIADGPRRMDRHQLELAVELLTDAADFADDDSVSEALGSTTPLGWFVDYAVNFDPKRLAPSPPFDNEADAWKALEHDFEERLQVRS